MDYRKLKGKVVEVYGTQEAFANAMDMSVAAVSQRLRGAVDWKTPEIVKACELLKIELSEAWRYFFKEKV